MSALTSDHAELINGLTRFHQTLLDMQYLREEDIIRPPHVREQIDLSALLNSGYTPETIALIL